MVINKKIIIEKRNALISLYDKKNLSFLCKKLHKFNINFLSTGKTAKEIIKLGYKCQIISKLTKFPEILNGRVKTLHPKIYASILHDRNNKKHLLKFNELHFPSIDFVIVNLYPFEKIIDNSKDENECIEMIDIGGPTMLRAAAKNFQSVTSIANVQDYRKLIQNLKNNNGSTSLRFRKNMAQKTFDIISNYDNIISNWLCKDSNEKLKLKYGENPNQKSIYCINKNQRSIFDEKINGKELGHNNILDIDSGLNCINEFNEPTCVIIKHNNPCGVSSNKSIYKAYKLALDCDPISSFGGVVILNQTVNKTLAKIMYNNFFEIIAAKDFNKDALKILKNKKKLILIKTKNLKQNIKKEIKNVVGGTLIQDKNIKFIRAIDLKQVSKLKANKKTKDDLVFALRVCKHVKSNAIVLAKNKQTIGIGAGQMSRVDSTKIAILKGKTKIFQKKFVAASDAFFPFTDNLKLLLNNNCNAIVQTFG